ncbi:MAG TPA: hypothetical protein VMW42_00705, partial [Desulfatiglandales bacterium]|nr:hypothetical protein [Desulfatiglandales bacterium]
MKIKNIFIMIAAVVSVFALTGAAFAVNTVGINVTSEPIRADAVCDKAGGFTLTFDKSTTLVHGDQITLDLTYGVTLCRDIDIALAANTGATLSATVDTTQGWLNTQTNTSAPVYIVEDLDADAASTGGGVYFHIYGTDGSPRITIDVIGGGSETATLTVGADAGDKLIMTFLGQRTNDDFAVDGIYTDTTTANTFNVAATVADNTICIDVSDPVFTQTVVNENFDSKGDKFTFVPSNPQVAHLGPSLNYQLTACAKDIDVGNIILGTKSSTQAGVTEDCVAFDFESGAGYCANTHGTNNMLLIESLSGAFESVNYQIQLEILVNGTTGYHGVAWTNQDVGADGFNDSTAACGAGAAVAVGAQANYTYYRYNTSGQLVAVTPATVEAAHANQCDIAPVAPATTPNAQATVLLTEASDLDLAVTNDILWVDMPALNYDLDDVDEGDVVSVVATLIKAPCGVLFEGEIEVGTFGCYVSPPAYNLIFPYFTEMDADADVFWDGIAIVNMTSADGTATLSIFEQDGDRGTVTVSVEAY